MSNVKNKKGFSLLEMMIVVSIIITMTMTMFVISFKDRDKKELETIGRSVAAAIRETQNNALTGKQENDDGLPCAFRFVTTVTGFKVQGSFRKKDEGCAADDVSAAYEGVNARLFAQDDFAKSKIEIIGRMSSDPDDTSDSIVFVVPHGKYINLKTKKADAVDFVIKNNKDDNRYHICVHATGLIEEIGFDKNEFACKF